MARPASEIVARLHHGRIDADSNLLVPRMELVLESAERDLEGAHIVPAATRNQLARERIHHRPGHLHPELSRARLAGNQEECNFVRVDVRAEVRMVRAEARRAVLVPPGGTESRLVEQLVDFLKLEEPALVLWISGAR